MLLMNSADWHYNAKIALCKASPTLTAEGAIQFYACVVSAVNGHLNVAD